MPIDIGPDDLTIVRAILEGHVPGREVRAFGSRVAGKAKAFSDLDLAVMGEVPISASVLADLHDAFRESDLPFKVDVVDWATTRESFRRVIGREFVVLGQEKVLSPCGDCVEMVRVPSLKEMRGILKGVVNDFQRDEDDRH